MYKYLAYEKPGKYGDPESKLYHVRMDEDEQRSGLSDERKALIRSLKEGDWIELSWNHDYVHQSGSSFPERPVVGLKQISEEQALRS